MPEYDGNASSRPWVRRRLRSFVHALRGVWQLRTEPNARIHSLATVAVLVAGVLVGLSALEWCALVLAAALVFAAEALNTALEYLANAVMPERHPLVGTAKDLAAGAVLITAVGAAIVGALVLGPHLVVIAKRGIGG
ncbi:MAG TPA: diacylglycerol kinase family protein [Polyangiaceae bacterium]|nr:diacylglycerol kinase family protein [Polyangiaceae bacterium]